jgi:hypothetical protein
MVLILNKIKEWGIKLKNKINQENNKKKQLKELRLSLMDEKKKWRMIKLKKHSNFINYFK